MDGSNGSTTFTDSSSNAFSATVLGNTNISTAQSKFGGSSGYFDGSGDSILYPNATTNAAFGFGTGDFTVEFWHYYQGGNGYVCMVQIVTESPNYIFYGLNLGSKGTFLWNNGNVAIGFTAVTNNVWEHHAVVRSGSTVSLYLNGNRVASNTWTVDLGTAGQAIIGANGANQQNTTGYIDEVRISKGIARYTGASFPVPTAPFS